MSASSRRRLWRSFAGVAVVAAATLSTLALAGSGELAQRIRRPSETPEVPPVPSPAPEPATSEGPDLSRQSQADVDRKNVGCVTCHTATDAPTMHTATTVKLACVDCHGGRGDVARAAATQPGSTTYDDVKKKAHVQPRLAELAKSAANPRAYVRLAQESADYVRFVNPGDLRAARLACGQSRCHAAEVAQVEKSMMTTGPMLWAAALYNNGSFPLKRPLFGESYTESGEPRRLYTTPPPTLEETVGNGVLPWLEPLPRFEIGQPSNVLRIFERGQQRPLELGVPNVDEAPGRPANRLSARGLGTLMYPGEEPRLTAEQIDTIERSNPDGAAVRGRWSDPEFLANVTELNPRLTRTQFADFHGHGWVFRAVFKQDRKGQLLDGAGAAVQPDDPERFKKAVHLRDIHLEKGMHCVDCHFKQDVHGNGKLYGETRAAIEITCTTCHGTIQQRATLKTSGPAAPAGGTDLSSLRTPFGQRRFQWLGEALTQRSMVTEGLQWTVTQVADTIDPASPWARANPERSAKSRLAKTLRRDGAAWGTAVAKEGEARELAHADARMTCQSCHTSWVTSCFGCHLPMRANRRKPMLHFEGDTQRNWTSYNFQTIRDDVFMLAIDPTVMKHRVSPARSSCAVLVGSQNQNREWVYSQQQTVSAEGFAGHAFSTFVPHTVRATETKSCTDCHVSARNDNNAWMAQVLMLGTNFYNFLGRYIYVAEGARGLEAIAVTERDEPQAVIGSELHRLAYPTNYAQHEHRGRRLGEALHHRGRDVLDVFGRDEVLSIQLRGEYLYTANGPGGFRAYDVAQIDQKGFSERLVTAPVSPLGQRLYVKTRFATAVASPTTLAVDPTRTQRPENQEQKIHPLYAYLYVTDRYEGLVVVGNRADSPHRPGVATLLDGNPANNFLERAATFNPDGLLDGAVNLTVAGR